MNWPSRSHDLKPIEHVCDGLRDFVQHNSPLKTRHEVKPVLLEKWDLLPHS